MSYKQVLYHIVLRTKYSKKSIAQHNVSSLYKYIWSIIRNKKREIVSNKPQSVIRSIGMFSNDGHQEKLRIIACEI
jgi:hypothetical protein